MEKYQFGINAIIERCVTGTFEIEAETEADAVAQLKSVLQDTGDNLHIDTVDGKFCIDWCDSFKWDELTGQSEVWLETDDDRIYVANMSSKNEVEFYQTKED